MLQPAESRLPDGPLPESDPHPRRSRTGDRFPPTVPAPPWTAATLAQALVDLLEEPFATPEDVGLDVRRVETVDELDGVDPGLGRVRTVELDLADGARFRLAVERVA